MIGIDHEYIAENAPNGMHPPVQRPDVKKVYCEVMQMGACKLDASGAEIDVLNITVNAHRIHEVPLWLTQMTGMTTERRESEGISFPRALEKLEAFVGSSTDVWTFSGDWWVLEGNAKAHGIILPFSQPFQRVKPLLESYGVTHYDYSALGYDEVNSGHLYEVLGLTLPKIEGVGAHDAAHDARSVAHSMHHLLYA